MDIIQYTNYRHYLNALCSQKDKPRGYRAFLAKQAGCQASYFSQVLQLKAHLTEDQLHGVLSSLNLLKTEMDYLILLLRFEKASTPKLRHYLSQAIDDKLRDIKSLKNQVEANEIINNNELAGIYFSSWLHGAIHLLTSDEKHQTVKEISQRLNLKEEKVLSSLHFLQSVGLIESIQNKWIYRRGSFHIPKDSLIHPLVELCRREMASRSIALNPEDSMHFSSVFTIDQAEYEQIQDILRKAISKSHTLIKKSGTSKLVGFCLDFFEIV